jgi:hypothetical protein
MKKSELKSGMLIETEAGEIGLVLLNTPGGDIIAGNGGEYPQTWFPLSNIDEDTLEYKSCPSANIVKVYGYKSNSDSAAISIKGRVLLWEKKAPLEKIKLSKEYSLEIDKNHIHIFNNNINSFVDSPILHEDIKHLYSTIKNCRPSDIKTVDKPKNIRIESKSKSWHLYNALASELIDLGFESKEAFTVFSKENSQSYHGLIISDSFNLSYGKPAFAFTNFSNDNESNDNEEILKTNSTIYNLDTMWPVIIEEAKKYIDYNKTYILDDIKIPNVKYNCRVDYIKETISIGCQTIPFSTLENIINLIK